ncbi:hypothetical protein ONE63_006870 [Megalurothrips usitatus]|uniref:Protein takeout-like n=1 Tax=Megalurothrips usitatus TaxID=439358 RepID=A0AAV7XTK2_9NEOP|nr:hypothetical protein ONE63_006870 [Megalurothrips usitatus]
MARVAFFTALAVLAVICPSHALRLPSYITPCRRSDPKLAECALKNGRDAVTKFVDGDRKYKIPSLKPLTLYNLHVDSGSNSVGIKLVFKEAQIYGLDGADIKAVNFDLDKKKASFDMVFPTLNIIGDYTISGRVLVLPISGQGPANVTVTDCAVTFSFDYELANKKKNGKEYATITDSNVKFTIGHGYFDLKNLFNGDKLLGDNMNTFLNENWSDVVKELGPSLADTIGAVIRQIIEQVVDVVPYEYIFTD